MKTRLSCNNSHAAPQFTVHFKDQNIYALLLLLLSIGRFEIHKNVLADSYYGPNAMINLFKFFSD